MPPLAEGFATPTREDWLKAVRAALKGEPFESLIHHTVEDLAIQPLYGPDGPPGRLRPRAARCVVHALHKRPRGRRPPRTGPSHRCIFGGTIHSEDT